MAYTQAPEGWWRDFVSASPPRTAKLAVVRADGSPFVVPVWIDLDGNDVVFETGADTVKGKAILRDPRICLCLDDEQPPFSFVTLAGEVTIDRDPATVRYWAARIAGRYMGAENAEAYADRNAVPTEMVVRLTPTRVIAKVDVADFE